MKYYYNNHFFSTIDKSIGNYITRMGGSSILAFSGALVSHAISNGDSCIDISKVLAKDIWPHEEEIDLLPSLPDYAEWREELRNYSPTNNSSKPLTINGNLLYITRLYKYEKTIIELFNSNTLNQLTPLFNEYTITLAKKLFEDTSTFDYQLSGALISFFFRLSIITGGPGTGKTTTVAKMLSLSLSQDITTRIALGAPTGKAGQRMLESLHSNVKSLNIPKEINSKLLSLHTETIHRLLGPIHNSSKFKHNRENPLPYDLIIIDEASMIDLQLMAKLIDAISPNSKLILLGDQYQLASVEAGAVLGDLCIKLKVNQLSNNFLKFYKMIKNSKILLDISENLSPVIELQKSYRFKSDSFLGLFSRAINSGDENQLEKAIDNLNECKGEVQLRDHLSIDDTIKYFTPLINSNNYKDALSKIGEYIILTSENRGKNGQETINSEIISKFSKRGNGDLIENMPILITGNSYSLSIFNGDIGVLSLIDNKWMAVFTSKDDDYRIIPLVLIPKWQPAFAITIHKSQGSEYSKLALIIGDKDKRLLTRELLYTAITRAKPKNNNSEESVIIYGSRDIIKKGAMRKRERVSGITEI